MVFQTFVNKNAIVTDSFETAKQSNKWSLWTKGNFAELDSIIENGVFEIVQKESQDKDKTLINTQWVLYKKIGTERNLKIYKVWCVVRGFEQKDE